MILYLVHLKAGSIYHIGTCPVSFSQSHNRSQYNWWGDHTSVGFLPHNHIRIQSIISYSHSHLSLPSFCNTHNLQGNTTLTLLNLLHGIERYPLYLKTKELFLRGPRINIEHRYCQSRSTTCFGVPTVKWALPVSTIKNIPRSWSCNLLNLQWKFLHLHP